MENALYGLLTTIAVGMFWFAIKIAQELKKAIEIDANGNIVQKDGKTV
ncbi:hypothetical protein [Dyadobacter sp. Leaf189]|nr:hypothetical protein [Dyadobacter sp. Leaf189]